MSAKSLRYIPSLNGLRGLPPIPVLATHYGYSKVGWIGLEFFFVLSGFLIASILLTETNRRLGGIWAVFTGDVCCGPLPGVFWLSSCLRGCVRVREAAQSFLDVLPSLAEADQFPALQHSRIETPLVVRYSFNWREFGR
jgi:hypothetical protein